MHVATILVLGLAAVVTNDGSLTGKVQDENGAPIAGATVDIYTAKPRVGAALTCPSCYRDCAKSTKTTADGKFELNSLDSGLLFRVLVMAPGRRSQLTELTDPQTTKLDVKLEPIPNDLPVNRLLTGRVLDDQGKPLAGAVVSPSGAKTSQRRWWGRLPGVDEASFTDADGKFAITSNEPKLGLDLQVTAPGFAGFPSQLFDLDGRDHEIRMQLGASVQGKLTFKGQPVTNRSIGIVQSDRSPEAFIGERVVVTDNSGSFQFTDLQPAQEYVLYTLCEPKPEVASEKLFVENQPVLKTQRLTTADSGGLTKLGELELRPGLTLTVRVTFPADKKSPDEVKVRLSRDPAWDWFEVTLPDNGEFKFHGLPSEVYSISVNAPGFAINASQFRYQMTGRSQFGIRLRSEDTSGKTISIPMRSTGK